MTEVQAVRLGLIRLRQRAVTEPEEALVSEGLAACDEVEKRAAGHDFAPEHCVVCAYRDAQLKLVASILKRAGLL